MGVIAFMSVFVQSTPHCTMKESEFPRRYQKVRDQYEVFIIQLCMKLKHELKHTDNTEEVQRRAQLLVSWLSNPTFPAQVKEEQKIELLSAIEQQVQLWIKEYQISSF